MSLRCLIIDDNASFRQEMGALLEEQGVDIVGGAASAAEALHQIAVLSPDVVLIDIDLGQDSGLQLARALPGGPGQPAPKVILISTHEESDYAELIQASPAVGFLPKTELCAAEVHRLLSAAQANRAGES